MVEILHTRNSLRLARNRLLERTIAPVEEPLTLDEAKLYLRMDSNTEDTLIEDLIITARMIAESWLKRSLVTQSWRISYNDGVANNVALPMGPVNSITSVVIHNQDESAETVASLHYWLNAARNAIIMQSNLVGFRIEITYATGFGDAEDVPHPIKQGMLAHVAALYEQRGDAVQMGIPTQTVSLYAPFREIAL